MKIHPLLVPPLLFLSAFLFDKLFIIGDLEKTYLTTASFLNFEHKERLIDELEEYLSLPERKKTIVLFGNSRTLSISNNYIEKNHPDWILFNFSVPGGTTDYFAYLLEKFERRGLEPEQIIITVTPQGMNQSAAVSMDEVLIYGLPFRFIARHAGRFRLDDLSNYAAKKMFVVYKYRPKLRVIEHRLEGNNLEAFDLFVAEVKRRLNEERGSVPYEKASELVVDEELLERNAESIWREFFVPFRISDGQVAFTEDCIRYAKATGAKTSLLWVRVSPNLRNRIRTEKVAPVKGKPGQRTTVVKAWKPEMEALAAKYDALFLDTNFEPGMTCDDFADASHMFTTCYGPLFDYLIREVSGP